MKITLKEQTSDVAVFEISHEYGKSQDLTFIYGKTGLSIYMHDSDRKLVVNKQYPNFKLDKIKYNGFSIDLVPSSMKPNEFINVSLREEQKHTDITIPVVNTRTYLYIYGDGEKASTTFEYSLATDSMLETDIEEFSLGTVIKVTDTKVSTIVTITTNNMFLYKLFGLHEGREVLLSDDLSKYISEHHKNLSKEQKEEIAEIQEVIKETLKTCDRVQVVYQG